MEEGEITIDALVDRIERLEQRVESLEGKKGKKSPLRSEGAEVFEHYSKAFEARYGTPPVRNAAVNTQAKLLVDRVGKEDAVSLIDYYLKQRDSFYTLNMHRLAFCLRDCETLVARMKSGIRVTTKQAQAIESGSGNVDASKSYLNKKHMKANDGAGS